MNFEEWFNTRLFVSSADTVKDRVALTNANIGLIINVSSKPFHEIREHVESNNRQYRWLPLSEKAENNINILAIIEEISHFSKSSNRGVVIHCEAGKNRSVTAAQAYYYFKTGRMMEKSESIKRFGQDRLDENLKRGSVPVLRKFMKMITGFRRSKDIEKSLQNAGIR